MSAPHCTVCDDTGEVGQRGSLDCTACNTAETRMRLNAHMAFALHMPVADRDWAVFQYAQGLAEGVVRDYMGPEIHCQEFHELAMDYRSAGTVFDVYSPQHAYERLCAYINERIAPVADQPSKESPQQAIVTAAIAWWENQRPLAYTKEQHIKNSTVNTGYFADGALAKAVAAYVAAPLPEAGSAVPAGEVVALPEKMSPEMRDAMWTAMTRHGAANLEYWIEDLYNDIRAFAITATKEPK